MLKGLEKFCPNRWALAACTPLPEGIIDSTGVLELVSHLQEHYQIEVKDEELIPDNLDSINAVAAFVARKKKHDSASGDFRAVS